ncbi:hypothetical protein, partial [Thalassotalea piscium]
MIKIKFLFIISLLFFGNSFAAFSQTKETATLLPQFNQTFNVSYDASTEHWFKFDKLAGEGVTVVASGHFNNSSGMNVFLYDAA